MAATKKMRKTTAAIHNVYSAALPVLNNALTAPATPKTTPGTNVWRNTSR